MPSKTKLKNAAIAAKTAALPNIPKELIDQFVTGPMTPEAVNAASMAFKEALIERALGAELGHHLGQPASADPPEPGGNHRNGTSAKTVLTDEGGVRIDVPCDRKGTFEPLRNGPSMLARMRLHFHLAYTGVAMEHPTVCEPRATGALAIMAGGIHARATANAGLRRTPAHS